MCSTVLTNQQWGLSLLLCSTHFRAPPPPLLDRYSIANPCPEHKGSLCEVFTPSPPPTSLLPAQSASPCSPLTVVDVLHLLDDGLSGTRQKFTHLFLCSHGREAGPLGGGWGWGWGVLPQMCHCSLLCLNLPPLLPPPTLPTPIPIHPPTHLNDNLSPQWRLATPPLSSCLFLHSHEEKEGGVSVVLTLWSKTCTIIGNMAVFLIW